MVGRVIGKGMIPKHGSRTIWNKPIMRECKVEATLQMECIYTYSSKRDAAEAARLVRSLGYFATVLPVANEYGVFTSKKKSAETDYSIRRA